MQALKQHLTGTENVCAVVVTDENLSCWRLIRCIAVFLAHTLLKLYCTFATVAISMRWSRCLVAKQSWLDLVSFNN